MNDQLNARKIEEALYSIKNSESDGALFRAGSVSGIIMKDKHVAFTIEIDPEDKDHVEVFRNAAEKAVLDLNGVLSATAMLTAHKSGPDSKPTQVPHTSASEQSGQKSTPHQPAKHVIAVASGKGGVGKSTTSINLALALSALGHKVGILDADIYGPSLPRLIGLNRKPESDGKKIIPIEAWGIQTMSIGYLVAEDAPTIWRGPMVMSAIEQMLRDVAWAQLDFLVIDMPPGTGDAQLTLSQRASLAGAVIISTPQDLSLIDARKGLNMFRKVNVPILGIIENMSRFVCTECGADHHVFGNGGAKAEAEKLGVPFLGEIPLEIKIRSTSDQGKPVVADQPDSTYARHYQTIASALTEQISQSITRSAPNIVIE